MNFNLLKMNPVEKKLLLGGTLNSLTFWGNRLAQEYVPEYPQVLKQQLDPHLPTNGEIISGVAVPLGLYTVKRVSKNSSTKEKVGDLAFGATLHAIPNMITQTAFQAAWTEGVKARPAARIATPMTQSKYGLTATNTNARATTTNVTPTRGLSKYVVTA